MIKIQLHSNHDICLSNVRQRRVFALERKEKDKWRYLDDLGQDHKKYRTYVLQRFFFKAIVIFVSDYLKSIFDTFTRLQARNKNQINDDPIVH